MNLFCHFSPYTENTPYLFFSTQHSIRKLSLGASSSEYADIVANQKGIVALDYDYYSNYVYWTDVRDERICRARIPSPGSDAGNAQESMAHSVFSLESQVASYKEHCLYLFSLLFRETL